MRLVPFVRRSLEAIGMAAECLAAIIVLCAWTAGHADEPTRLPALAEVCERLDALEAQNAQLAEQNAALRRSLAARDHGPHEAAFIADGPQPPDVPMELEAELQKLGGAVEQLGAGMQQMQSGVEELAAASRVTTLREHSKIALFGEIRGESLWSDTRPLIPSAPLLLAPAPAVPGFDDDTFSVGAKPSLLGAGFQGPEIGCCETGGVVLFALFSETVVEDIYGIMPLHAYGEIKNDHGRFAAGLMSDIFNPLIPTMVNFNNMWASGNTGAYRGQMRVERYLYPTCDAQITLQANIGDPLPTTIVDRRFLGAILSEDNGWPNVEGRIAYGYGPLCGEGAAAKRPLEVGVSGLVGEIRSTEVLVRQVVADAWGIGVDARIELTSRCGVQGEWFRGKTLGTYQGGVAQTVNTLTLAGIHSQGGFGEVYYYINPCVHLHAGYGVDDPHDEDLFDGQIEYNETIYGTIFWQVTAALRLGLEVSHRQTDYLLLPDNEGTLVHTQVQWSF